MSKSSKSIIVKNLRKSYGENEVLKGISLTVSEGTMLALLGPNGAGKTTIVRILSTLLEPDGGSVEVKGHNLAKDAAGIRSVIGLTGQSAAIDELLTGRENLVMMGMLYRLTKASAKVRANELLEEFDLVEASDRPTRTYSGGMRRRLDLAVSLIATPPIIFLDEPTTGLDPRSRLVMWDIIKNLMKSGTTILLTTQYLEEADQLADNIILINNGKVAAEGSAKELKKQIGNDRLQLQFSSQLDLNKAQETLGSASTIVSDDPLSLTMPIKSNGEDVRETLDILKKEKLTIKSMDIHKPTLDDVFMNITEKGDN